MPELTTASPSFTAAKHVLSADSLDLHNFIDDKRGIIDWQTLRETSGMFSSGEQVLVDVALQIWNGSSFDNTRVADLFKLDNENLIRVLEAIQIKRGLLEPSAVA